MARPVLLAQPERIEILFSCGEMCKPLHYLAQFEPRRAACWADDGVKMHPNISGSPFRLPCRCGLLAVRDQGRVRDRKGRRVERLFPTGLSTRHLTETFGSVSCLLPRCAPCVEINGAILFFLSPLMLICMKRVMVTAVSFSAGERKQACTHSFSLLSYKSSSRVGAADPDHPLFPSFLCPFCLPRPVVCFLSALLS